MKDEPLGAWHERLRQLVARAIGVTEVHEARSMARAACRIMVEDRVRLVDGPTSRALHEHMKKGEEGAACELVHANGYRVRPHVSVLLAARTLDEAGAFVAEYGGRFVDGAVRRLYGEAHCERCERRIAPRDPFFEYRLLEPAAVLHIAGCSERSDAAFEAAMRELDKD